MAVEARGGTIIVQDPQQAQNGDMPANVLRQIKTETLPALAGNSAIVGHTNPQRGSEPPGMNRAPRTAEASTRKKACPSPNPSRIRVLSVTARFLRELLYGEIRTVFVATLAIVYSFGKLFGGGMRMRSSALLWMALQRLNEQRSIQDNLAKRA